MSSRQDRNLAGIIAIVFAALLIFSVIAYVWFPFSMWTNQRDAGEEIVNEEVSAEKALQNYRWFRSQWFDIQAQREQLNNSYEAEEEFHSTYGDDPSEWSRQAEERHGRLHERITGNRNMLEKMVAEYNERSTDATRAIWKCHLPYQVDQRFAIQGPPGSDAPEQPQDKYVDGAEPGERPPEAEQCDSLPKQADS